MNVDVIITGRDAEKHIADCVAAVRASEFYKGELRLCYVDQGSSDSSVLLARRIEGLEVLHGGARPLGRAQARNLGWRRGKAPAVLFLDVRSRLDPGWIETAVRALDRDVGAVTGPLQPAPGCSFWAKALIWEDCPRHDVDDPLPASQCLLRRKVLRRARGFLQTAEPESMADLGAWMLDHGWLVRVTHEVAATVHAPALDLPAYLVRCFRQGAAYAQIRRRLGLWRLTPPGRAGAKAMRAVLRCSSALAMTALGLSAVFGSRLEFAPLLPFGLLAAVFPRVWRYGEFATQRALSIQEGQHFAWARCLAGFAWAAGFLFRLVIRPPKPAGRSPKQPGPRPG
ncbi:MAG: glycosyltransferase [Desulfovibrionaceae bacterium]